MIIISNVLINIHTFVILSINDVPIYPQKYTIDIFATTTAAKNFLNDIFDNPAAIFTANAAVNGKAVIITSAV